MLVGGLEALQNLLNTLELNITEYNTIFTIKQ
jgi:hypothetical protein